MDNKSIQTQHIAYIRKRKRYSIWELNGLIIGAVDEGGAATPGEGELITPPRDTNSFLFELADYGIVGLKYAAADDLAYFFVPCPYDLDPDYEVGFRVNFTQSAAVSTEVTWILLVGTDKADAVIQAEDAAGIVALDTALAVKAAGGSAYENLWTPRGIKLAIGLTRTEIVKGALIRFSLEAQALGVGIANLTLLGLEMDYVLTNTTGPGAVSDQPLLDRA